MPKTINKIWRDRSNKYKSTMFYSENEVRRAIENVRSDALWHFFLPLYRLEKILKLR